MRRVLNVIRLQMINKQTFIWTPLIILGSAAVMSILIYAMIPGDGPFYGGGGQAPLWYFFAIGMSARADLLEGRAVAVEARMLKLEMKVEAILDAYSCDPNRCP